MYSREDRERILADLAESGMPAAAFCRLPGTPSRQSIRDWLRQAERGELDVPERRVRGRCEHARHSRYPETRREAVSLVRAGMRPADVARRLGVSSGSLVASWSRGAPAGATMAPKGAVRMGAEAQARIAELEAELEAERLTADALRELMRDPKAGDPASLSNSQKAELGERLRRDCGYRLKDPLPFLRISKSSHEYARAANERRAARSGEVAARVRAAFEASERRCGYRRVRASAAAGPDGGEPMRVSEREVRRAMREGGMVARRTRGRRGYGSYAGEPDGRPANVPPGGTGPTTSPPTPPTGSSSPTSPSSRSAGRAAPRSTSRRSSSTPTGAAPTGAARGRRCARRGGAVRSMSRKGCCPDNARMEGFFGTLKEEFFYGRDWAGVSVEEFEGALGGYMRWYRDERLKGFDEGGRRVYDTIAGRRRRLGHVVA